MTQTEIKKLVAEKAVEFVTDGMIVGLGTGSTAFWAIQRLGQRVSEGLKIEAVASSLASEELAKKLNIPIRSFAGIGEIDITIDGADEVDRHHNLIKGGGGALLREKIIAYNSKRFFVVVDEAKVVEELGSFPLPVEILPFAYELTLRQLTALGCDPEIRTTDGKVFVSDNGSLIADCAFGKIEYPLTLEKQLQEIPGVIETGLFLNTMVDSVFIGYKNGAVLRKQH